VRLTFDGVRLGISAGCNQMGGEYSITDGVLQIGPMMTTEMACEEPLMSQDAWISAFLPGATLALAGETLTIVKDGVTLTLLDEEVANPDRALEGTRWVVNSLVTADAVSSIPAGATASLVFDGGTVRVEAGCNTGSGSYTLGEGSIAFGPIGTTMMACPDDVMALEAAVLQVLDGEATYTIDADTLTLQNGASGLVLAAAS
jgi:heat shock protein HslJ